MSLDYSSVESHEEELDETEKKERKIDGEEENIMNKFLSITYAMSSSKGNAMILDLFVIFITYIRLILWPVYILADSNDWKPKTLVLIVKTFVSFISDLRTVFDSDQTLFYLYITLASICVIQLILLVVAVLNQSSRRNLTFMFILRISLGLLPYTFTNFLIEIFTLGFRCDFFTNIPCDNMERNFLYTFSSIGIVSVVICSAFYSLINFDFKIFSDNIFHREPGDDIIMMWLLQLVSSLLHIYQELFEDFPEITEIYILTLLSLVYAFLMISKIFYYNGYVSKVIRIMSVLIFTSNFTILILIENPWSSSDSVFYLWIVIQILVAVSMSIKDKDRIIINTLLSSTEVHKLAFFVYESLSSKDYVRGNMLQMQGFIYGHVKHCNDPDCPLMNSLLNVDKEFSSRENCERLQKCIIIKYLSYKIAKALDSNPYNSELRLERAQFMFEILQNNRRAKIELIQVKPKGIIERIWKFNLLRVISEFDYSNNNINAQEDIKSNEIKKKKEAMLIKLRRAEEKLSDAEWQSASACFKLWNYSSMARPKLDFLETLIINAVDTYDVVARLWKEIETYSHIPSFMRKLYAVYMRDILGDHAAFSWHNQMYS